MTRSIGTGGLVFALSAALAAQSPRELRALVTPRALALSPDGSRLSYTLGPDRWEVDTAPGARPRRAAEPAAPAAAPPAPVGGRAGARPSPDGTRLAYLDTATPAGPQQLFCECDPQGTPGPARLVSPMPVMAFAWTSDASAFWVLGIDGADEPIGRLTVSGVFTAVTDGPAMRRGSGLVVAGDVLAWVQSDGAHDGTIWIRDAGGRTRTLVDPNPQIAGWGLGPQQVVRWTNAHGEVVHGVLATPRGTGPWPLVVDPYSSWRNRFLKIPVLGNYAFVKAGFAVFFPDHRAPHTFPAASFGAAYVGASRDRDPVEVLTDDVMTGVADLVRRKIADEHALFLYSSSNGASAIDQLLTRTGAFRAAVSHAGVADWLGAYEAHRTQVDDTIATFLGGRKPEDSPELYRSISPIYHVNSIRTPLRLVIGRKDTRYGDTMAFYEALRRAGSPVTLIVYPEEGHEIASAAVAEQHVEQTLEFFRSFLKSGGR